MFEHFNQSNCLITGGLGFIGSTLAQRLIALGAHVTLVDALIPNHGGNLFNIASFREQVQLHQIDVRTPQALDALLPGQHYLFNLAGQTSHLDSMSDPHSDLDINCRAQLSILEACRAHNPAIKIVFASTRQVYGKPERLPVDETHPTRPVDVNGINKLAGEEYHLLYHQVYGLRSVALRLTNTYGPRMRIKDARQTFLGDWIRRLLTGEPILVFGDGRQLRDFNHVDDVVDGLLRAASSEAANGQVLNLGSSEVISLGELAQQLVRVNGAGSVRFQVFPPERKIIDIGDYHADWHRAHALLGWSPRVSLETGLRDTLDYFRVHAQHYI